MTKRLKSFARLALKVANRSYGKQRVGCVVIGSGSRVLACESNNYTNGLHAEVRALSRVPAENRASCTILVVRARKSQEMGMSRPCLSCQHFLESNGVSAVYYSDDSGGITPLTASLPRVANRFWMANQQRVNLRLNRLESS